jgi:hypothetical protein
MINRKNIQDYLRYNNRNKNICVVHYHEEKDRLFATILRTGIEREEVSFSKNRMESWLLKGRLRKVLKSF